nr:pentatricopeptide repeat-containing protein At1g26900, mitochondrial [Ipomoea batatas]
MNTTVIPPLLRQKCKLFFPKFFRIRHQSTLSLNQNLVILLQSCKGTLEISQIHGLMIKTGLDLAPFTLSKLLANSIHHTSYAAKILKYIKSPNLYMFNTLLRSYSISDRPGEALILLNHMRAQSLMLDQFTFVSALKSCARASQIRTGLGVHSVLLRNGFVLFLNVMNSLLHFYCACGWVSDAHKLFDEFSVERDLVSWNTLMGGYLCVHKYSIVIDLFKQIHRDGIGVSVTTILGILSAVGELKGQVLGGECMHGYCIKVGLSMNLNVTSALISMYGKTSGIGSGHKVFDEADAKDVVLWNCLIDRYAKSGMLEEAFKLLSLMKVQGVKPNSSTFVGLLSVSAASGGLSVGRCVHDYIKEHQLVIDAILGTALINMYTKCGLLKEAIEVFDNVDRKDLMCWTAMISAYGVHGQAENAIVLFHRMEEEGFRPNEVTFLAVLNACSHNGLVADGKNCFRRMVEQYSLSPKVEHYGCVIDLLGRAGLLEEARKLIESLPIEEDATAWRALLAACRVYGDISLGEQVKRELEQRFDEHPADSLTLTSAYAIAGRMEDHASLLEKNEGKPIEEWKYFPIGKKQVGFSRVAA